MDRDACHLVGRIKERASEFIPFYKPGFTNCDEMAP